MTDEDYKRTMHTAIDELSALMEERELIDDRRQKITRRIDALRDVIVGLSALAGEDPYTTRPELFPNIIPPDTGLTEAVSEVMSSLDAYVSTVDIRDTLAARGFNVKRYKNVLSAIHQILSRLVESGKVEKHEDEEKKLYRWKKMMGGTRVPGSTGGAGRPFDAPDAGLSRPPKAVATETKNPRPRVSTGTEASATLSRPPRLATGEDPSKSPRLERPKILGRELKLSPSNQKIADEAAARVIRKGTEEELKRKESK